MLEAFLDTPPLASGDPAVITDQPEVEDAAGSDIPIDVLLIFGEPMSPPPTTALPGDSPFPAPFRILVELIPPLSELVALFVPLAMLGCCSDCPYWWIRSYSNRSSIP